MNISKVNDLLGQVRVKLESLDCGATEEGIQEMPVGGGKSISAANGRLNHLMGKLTANRGKANKVVSTGSKKRG